MIIDEDGAWTAAAYLIDDMTFGGAQHGIGDEGATLCGLPSAAITIVRNPFYGDGLRDCYTCAVALSALADAQAN